ncbi:hypothetical protein GIB67_002660 [Kingdonia uniflora]|uniref:RRM domain-containing protein n=1 Tax=Kingdonia uniflora TaxID=39325 RepID=A0A7J7LJF9_9MAGN|nr:hypothetical protein GIB67_002660 [Kingdonia uniflora]
MNVVFIRKRVHEKKAKNDDKVKLVLYSLHSSMEDMKSSINPVKRAFIIREEVMMVKEYSEHFLCNAWYIMMHDPVALQLFMAGDAKDKKMVKGEQKVAKTTIFVGDLGSDVTDAILQETFGSKFPSVKGAKVVIDATTDRSKGYGFMRFGDDNERSQALTEMNGAYCSNRPMYINVATPRKPSEYQQQSQAVVLGGEYGSNGASSQNFQTDEDSNNTTIFVGGLDASIIDEDLRRQFSQFGKIVSVKIPVGKGCGFVPVNRQPRSNNGNQWNGRSAYYGGQTYDGSYGYATPVSQDPNMYAAAAATAYGAYPTYGKFSEDHKSAMKTSVNPFKSFVRIDHLRIDLGLSFTLDRKIKVGSMYWDFGLC